MVYLQKEFHNIKRDGDSVGFKKVPKENKGFFGKYEHIMNMENIHERVIKIELKTFHKSSMVR